VNFLTTKVPRRWLLFQGFEDSAVLSVSSAIVQCTISTPGYAADRKQSNSKTESSRR
jgi:hypothetical protein